jgi:hypothetical protein
LDSSIWHRLFLSPVTTHGHFPSIIIKKTKVSSKKTLSTIFFEPFYTSPNRIIHEIATVPVHSRSVLNWEKRNASVLGSPESSGAPSGAGHDCFSWTISD